MSFFDDLMDACQAQATWMENSSYGWQPNPTIPKSKYKGSCVTYVACVLQRVDVLASGKYVWHDKKGNVTGSNSKMTVFYPNKIMEDLKNDLQAGDIIMDGDKTDTGLGSHEFILSGRWDGDYPYVWDNHSAQQQLGEYKYTRNRNVFAVVRLNTITPFVPRLTSDGMRGNPYYYSRNPFYLAGFGLPNCTCYSWGRFWEVADVDHDYSNRPTLCTTNANDWYNYNDGYERGQTPQLGAIACFYGGPFSGDGHVCNVEEILPNGDIVCSNSAWNGSYFYLTTLSPPNYLPASGYIFQGFIYNPHSGGSPWWSKGIKAWLYKKWLWNREAELLQ